MNKNQIKTGLKCLALLYVVLGVAFFFAINTGIKGLSMMLIQYSFLYADLFTKILFGVGLISALMSGSIIYFGLKSVVQKWNTISQSEFN